MENREQHLSSLSAAERELLSAYLDGELLPEEEAQVQVLLRQNPDAQKYLASFEKIQSLTTSLQAAEPSPKLAPKIIQSLKPQAFKQPSHSLSQNHKIRKEPLSLWARLSWKLAFACSLVLLLGLSAVFVYPYLFPQHEREGPSLYVQDETTQAIQTREQASAKATTNETELQKRELLEDETLEKKIKTRDSSEASKQKNSKFAHPSASKSNNSQSDSESWGQEEANTGLSEELLEPLKEEYSEPQIQILKIQDFQKDSNSFSMQNQELEGLERATSQELAQRSGNMLQANLSFIPEAEAEKVYAFLYQTASAYNANLFLIETQETAKSRKNRPTRQSGQNSNFDGHPGHKPLLPPVAEPIPALSYHAYQGIVIEATESEILDILRKIELSTGPELAELMITQETSSSLRQRHSLNAKNKSSSPSASLDMETQSSEDLEKEASSHGHSPLAPEQEQDKILDGSSHSENKGETLEDGSMEEEGFLPSSGFTRNEAQERPLRLFLKVTHR